MVENLRVSWSKQHQSEDVFNMWCLGWASTSTSNSSLTNWKGRRRRWRAKQDRLSHGGLFVVTNRPMAPGSRLKMRIQLDGYSLPLSGRVAWARTKAETGRPAGLGVELAKAPPMYRRYIDELQAHHDEAGEEQTESGLEE